jgi:hypothetical protein
MGGHKARFRGAGGPGDIGRDLKGTGESARMDMGWGGGERRGRKGQGFLAAKEGDVQSLWDGEK